MNTVEKDIVSRQLETARLRTHMLERAAAEVGTRRVLLIHGNVSSGEFFRELMASVPPSWHVVAPDLRGYGHTEAAPIDAVRGVRDWADDLDALLDALNWPDADVLGWSMGGGVALQLAVQSTRRVRSLTLVAPVSPYGFGGTHGAEGTPNSPDFAGSGGGTVNAAFVAAVAAGDRSDAPGSPRDVLRKFYVNPARFAPTAEQEERWLESMLHTRTGDDFYPGDAAASPHWPHVAPGTRGVANAFSAQHMNVSAFADLNPPPPVLWVRGDADAIIGDSSLFDLAHLGALGAVPGWPGAQACPPQPMLAQTRALLERATQQGGEFREVVLPGVGHSPFIEAPGEFLAAFTAHLEGQH
ncbi:alpha/beta hydrolase [Deinococcus sp. Arct2-2]|uniref:alpha/beta fold hydrolase n=1 Tax=Deinococcus sp. Arct2-2 TaxID=2568653 RepID=UPI0010A53DC1|nr:alpha/beta hydrolase [Deinococcus sp. Arct2-2]THF67841.1 alpha/beta hydrolase [Deinococcus sp. Arct2-2]